MDAFRKSLLLVVAALAAFVLAAGPVSAAPEGVVAAETEAPAETGDEGGRPAVADTPRDRVGLILLGLLGLAGVVGFANARRQLKGERPQATGEFRWR